MRLLWVIVILGLLTLPAQAQEAGLRAGAIVVRATGAVSAPPQIATFRVDIAHEAPTIEEAAAKSGPAVERVKAIAGKVGVQAQDVETVFSSVSPNREQSSLLSAPFAENTKPKIAGYGARVILRVTLRDASRAEALMEAFLSAGIPLSAVELGLADPGKAHDDARRKAVEEARRLAALYAQAAGVELGALLSLTEETRPTPAELPGVDRYDSYGKARPQLLLVRPATIAVRAEIVTTWAVKAAPTP